MGPETYFTISQSPHAAYLFDQYILPYGLAIVGVSIAAVLYLQRDRFGDNMRNPMIIGALVFWIAATSLFFYQLSGGDETSHYYFDSDDTMRASTSYEGYLIYDQVITAGSVLHSVEHPFICVPSCEYVVLSDNGHIAKLTHDLTSPLRACNSTRSPTGKYLVIAQPIEDKEFNIWTVCDQGQSIEWGFTPWNQALRIRYWEH